MNERIIKAHAGYEVIVEAIQLKRLPVIGWSIRMTGVQPITLMGVCPDYDALILPDGVSVIGRVEDEYRRFATEADWRDAVKPREQE